MKQKTVTENESHSGHIYVDSTSLLGEFVLSRACLITTQISLYLKLSKCVHSKRPAPVPLKLESKDLPPPAPGKTLALTPAEVPVRISLNANLSGARSCSRALSESVWQSACMMTICYRNTLLFLRKKICGCFPLWRPPPREGRCVTVPSPPLRQQHNQRVLSGSKTKELTASVNYLTDNQHFFKLTLASPLFSR